MHSRLSTASIVDSNERSTSTCLDVVWSGGITAQVNGGCVKSAELSADEQQNDINLRGVARVSGLFPCQPLTSKSVRATVKATSPLSQIRASSIPVLPASTPRD